VAHLPNWPVCPPFTLDNLKDLYNLKNRAYIGLQHY
jgi:hypothetical protein